MLTQAMTLLYAATGCALFLLGMHALMAVPHLLKKVLGINIAGSGVFLVFVSLAYRGRESAPDPIPHAMALTGIVVAVCGTAVALLLAGRVRAATGADDGEEPPTPTPTRAGS